MDVMVRWQELMERIQRAHSIDELVPDLEALYSVAERKLEQAAPESPVVLNRLAGYLAEVRFLLDQLGGRSARLLCGDRVRSLAGRYRDLEGRVKEHRNDLILASLAREKGGRGEMLH